jgi:hypothetical protein
MLSAGSVGSGGRPPVAPVPVPVPEMGPRVGEEGFEDVAVPTGGVPGMCIGVRSK